MDSLVATANLVTLVLQAKRDHKVLLVHLAKAGGHPVLLALKVTLVDEVSLDRTESEVLLANLVFRVKLVHLGNRDLSVPLVLPVSLESLGDKEKTVLQDRKVFEVNKATKDILANPESLDNLARQDLKAHRVLKESKAQWALLAPWVLLELMELMGNPVHPARLALTATTESPELMVNPVLPAKLAQRVIKANLVHPVRPALLD